ncbi:hypothetical protein H8959_013942, partial [Pygathrix nigripes]
PRGAASGPSECSCLRGAAPGRRLPLPPAAPRQVQKLQRPQQPSAPPPRGRMPPAPRPGTRGAPGGRLKVTRHLDTKHPHSNRPFWMISHKAEGNQRGWRLEKDCEEIHKLIVTGRARRDNTQHVRDALRPWPQKSRNEPSILDNQGWL